MKTFIYLLVALLVSSCMAGSYKPDYIMTQTQTQQENESSCSQEQPSSRKSIAD